MVAHSFRWRYNGFNNRPFFKFQNILKERDIFLCPSITRSHIFRCGPRRCSDAVIGRLEQNYNGEGHTLILSGAGSARAPKSLLGSYWGHQADEIHRVEIGEGITELETGIFRNLKQLKSVSFPSTLRAIYSDAFAHCEQLETIHLPDELEYVGPGAFRNCTSLCSVTFGRNLRWLHSQAFADCIRLVFVRLPDSLKHLGEEAFLHCSSLAQVRLPSSLKIIRTNAFKGCHSLQNIALGSGVESIQDGAFRKCMALHTIDLRNAKDLTSIHESAFHGCKQLHTIRCTPAQKLLFQRYFQEACCP